LKNKTLCWKTKTYLKTKTPILENEDLLENEVPLYWKTKTLFFAEKICCWEKKLKTKTPIAV
jgi:hypothetical protein